MEGSRTEDAAGIPHRARQETDRRLNRWHLFLLFKGTSRCVVSEMRKLCLLLHLLLLWCRFLFLGLFFFSSSLFLCLRGGTFYPILLALSVAMLSTGDQQSSPSKFGFHFYPFVCFSVLRWDFPPLYITRGPTEVCSCAFPLSRWVLWSSFIRLVWVGTDNWIGTSRPLERHKNLIFLYFQICHCRLFLYLAASI